MAEFEIWQNVSNNRIVIRKADDDNCTTGSERIYPGGLLVITEEQREAVEGRAVSAALNLFANGTLELVSTGGGGGGGADLLDAQFNWNIAHVGYSATSKLTQALRELQTATSPRFLATEGQAAPLVGDLFDLLDTFSLTMRDFTVDGDLTGKPIVSLPAGDMENVAFGTVFSAAVPTSELEAREVGVLTGYEIEVELVEGLVLDLVVAIEEMTGHTLKNGGSYDENLTLLDDGSSFGVPGKAISAFSLNSETMKYRFILALTTPLAPQGEDVAIQSLGISFYISDAENPLDGTEKFRINYVKALYAPIEHKLAAEHFQPGPKYIDIELPAVDQVEPFAVTFDSPEPGLVTVDLSSFGVVGLASRVSVEVKETASPYIRRDDWNPLSDGGGFCGSAAPSDELSFIVFGDWKGLTS